MTTVSDDVETSLAAGRCVANILHPTHKVKYPTLHALYAWGKMSAFIALCTDKVCLYTVMY